MIIKATVNRIELPEDKRVIVVSDIHGNLKLFQRLLKELDYSDKDILILLGDLIEKGDENLEALRYIMDLARKNTVHIVSGNCDDIWRDVVEEVDDDNLLRYMRLRKKSILNEMYEALGYEVEETSDIKQIKKQLTDNFRAEWDWMAKLPHIIETKHFIFAHAGIETEELDENDWWPVIKNDAFLEKGLHFSKYVVVGHWPVINYCREWGCYNPIIDKERRVISIDGGNVIKKEGQLNALILSSGEAEIFSFYAVDDLPKGVVIQNQESNQDTIQITWRDNAVEVLEEAEEFSLCRHISSKHELLVHNTKLFKDKAGIQRCDDYTDYMLPVSEGDTVSIVERMGKQTLVKKDGIVGWVLNEKLKFE